MENSILTKTSTENEIKTYFKKVLELKQSNNDFPVNLDDVWPLVYAEKGKAVRALKKDFIENEDFVSLAQNGKREIGATIINSYFLSLSCLEYFIARKVRPIFDVYRQVFHKIAEQKPLSQLEIIAQSVQILVEQEKRLSTIETKVDSILEKQNEAERELKALPVSSEKVPEMSLSDKCRLLVNRYCTATGTYHQAVWDNIYQALYYNYHISIKSYKKITKNESWIQVADRKGFIDKIYVIISNLLKERGIAA